MAIKNTFTALALGLSFVISSNLMAQDDHEHANQLQAKAQQQTFAIGGGGGQLAPAPKLGLFGHMDYRGLVVERVDYGSPAWKLGLEAGDVIVRINGRKIDCWQTYRTLLSDAVNFKHGHINVRIENVRWHTGESYERYVNATTHLPTSQPGYYGGSGSGSFGG